jgi:NAD(P)-dependent dehydrogenase (short-subunit alcohol dehydrogenase family)
MSNRVAIITGAGSGIGRNVAMALARRGYRLALAGRKVDALEETRTLLDSTDETALCIATDVLEESDIARLFAQTVDTFGRVDLLFNNAGINVPGVALEDLSSSDWRRVIDTNLTGAFLCLQAAFRAMKQQDPQGGRIINNGSISATSPRPASAPYTASKHAITGLTKSASLDGRRYNIACGQIDIGNAASAMGGRMAHGVPQANGTIAAEPVMSLDHVGEAVAYMDSLPLDANVQFMTLMATAMPFIGRG